MIVDRTEPFLGILIRYDAPALPDSHRVDVRPAPAGNGPINLAVIGAGNYAQGYLLPNLASAASGLHRNLVMTSSGATSRGVAERFGFHGCTSSSSDIFENAEINTVLVSTRHDSHATYVVESIRAGKNILVDKPLCITPEELQNIQDTLEQTNEPPLVMVGYNRRFSPLALEMRSYFSAGPMSMLYRVNAGKISEKHWTQDEEIGGGRIVGEVCHFIDFMVFLSAALPVSVSAFALPDPHGLQDSVHINLVFSDGSTGSILYLANGAKSVAKEYIEVFADGQTASITDFKSLEYHGGRRPRKKDIQRC